jgi:glycosyltransferase involved in cell wall biosynthesis
VLYLGRLHPVKGLERLITAWSNIALSHHNWHLVLAGPSDPSYLKCLHRLVAQKNCMDSISFIGSVNDFEKWQMMNEAELFVMPSDFENFGLAIVEAMSAGLPVIATTGSPWGCLEYQQAGWYISPTVSALEKVLNVALSMQNTELGEIGKRGRLIADEFSPEQIAKKFELLYRWLCDRTSLPEFVDHVN